MCLGWCNLCLLTQYARSQKSKREQQKRQAQEFMNALREKSESLSMKNTFIATLTHEIRNFVSKYVCPFNRSIVANASVLKDSGVWNEEVVEELVQASGVLSELLHNTLDISKLDEGKVDFNNNYEAIRGLVTLVLGLTKKAAEHKNVKLEVRYGPSLPPLLEFDKSRLTQVVMNLVTNAIKFTPPQGNVTVAVTWAWKCGQHSGLCEGCPDYSLSPSPKTLSDVTPTVFQNPPHILVPLSNLP